MKPHTSLVIQSISSLLAIICLGGCALFGPAHKPPELYGPQEDVFYATYDKVWLATQRAVVTYPIRVNNMDLGVIETGYIKGYKAWAPPYQPKPHPGGYRYKLNLKVIPGQLKGDPAVKVSVLKEVEIQNDFFSEPRRLPSNGYEELSILYRVQRELEIDHALEKAQKRMNKGF